MTILHLFCKSYTGCQLGIKYILLLTFEALKGMAPAYISDLINVIHCAQIHYSITSYREMRKSVGDRSFSVALPRLFLTLKSSLKTSF